MSRSVFRTAAALSMLAPAFAAAQGLSIEHQPAACIVAGRPAMLRACFVPIAELAAARVHFRPESRESWSQVEMRADAGCYTGVLPALGRDLVGRKILYSIEGVDRTSASHRTAEFAPVVVARAADCGGAVAPVSGRGLSKGVVIGGVAAAGVAGGVIAAGGDAADRETRIGTPPTTTAPPATQPAAPTPTPVPGAGLAVACQADPRSGAAPLRTAFTTFPTGATGSYVFEWSFGDGESSNNPNPSHTYAGAGRFDAVVRVTSGGETATCTRDITVTVPPGPGPAPTPTPTPSPTPTPAPTPAPQRRLLVSVFSFGAANVRVVPPGADCRVPAPNGQPWINCTFTYSHGTVVTLTGSPMDGRWANSDCLGQPATCILVMDADKTASWSGLIGGRPAVPEAMSSPIVVSSQLDVEGGVGRVSVNGATTSVSAGPQQLGVHGRTGASVVEAVLERTAGRAGTWRFALDGIRPGSLQVIAGTVVLITPDAVVFRLEGKPGERVVFTFEVDP